MQRQVTLAEVAREAGVSPSTVSRILTGSARVRSDKEIQVRQAIEKLGYRPNTFARGLVTGSSGSVGVLTQDIASPFYNDALSGIERGLLGSGGSSNLRVDQIGKSVGEYLRAKHVPGPR